MLPKKSRRRRKIHELDRSFNCVYSGCDRRYASESALNHHLFLKHQIKECNTGAKNSPIINSTLDSTPIHSLGRFEPDPVNTLLRQESSSSYLSPGDSVMTDTDSISTDSIRSVSDSISIAKLLLIADPSTPDLE
eukprot:Ihof_evm3s691 gene=Ihof_evmTU3s691